MKEKITHDCPSGMGYILGFIGAAAYYISTANAFFWAGAIGLLKALVWPGFLVFELFTFLGV